MADFNLNILYSQAFGVGVNVLKDAGVLDSLRSSVGLPFPLIRTENNQNTLPTPAKPAELPRFYKDLPTSCKFENANLRPALVTLPLPPVIEIQSRANVISTPVAGRNGTVKEIIAKEDKRATIKGIIPPQFENIVLVDDFGNVTVKSNEIQLSWYFLLESLVGNVWDVTCPLLNEIGVTSCVVESVNFPDASQYAGVILYQIQLVSDNPVELIIKEKGV